MIEGALAEVAVCVGGFPVNVVVQGAIRISGDANSSRNGILSSSSTSIVNLMLECCLLRCFRKS